MWSRFLLYAYHPLSHKREHVRVNKCEYELDVMSTFVRVVPAWNFFANKNGWR